MSGIVLLRRGRRSLVAVTTVGVAVALVPSLLLLTACLSGDCL